MAAGTCAEAAGAAFGGIYWGMTGLCAGWAVCATCEGVILLPAVLQVFRTDPADESHPGASSGLVSAGRRHNAPRPTAG
jgi:hypothetical protein